MNWTVNGTLSPAGRQVPVKLSRYQRSFGVIRFPVMMLFNVITEAWLQVPDRLQ